MGVEASWLAARVEADDAAREATVQTLLPRLVDAVRRDSTTHVRLIDIGAGSGANQRWLAPRLPFGQHWVHLDHDPAILEHTHQVGDTEFVVGGMITLRRLLADDRRPTVITCAAVLDVLTRADLELLGRTIVERCVPALLSLSVTGEVVLEPADDLDQTLLAAFDAHQRRGGRAGPDAPDLLAAQCLAAGVAVVTVETAWHLTCDSDPDFVTRFLTERVAAAVEQDPDLAGRADGWLARRYVQRGGGEFSVEVGHRDLLLLPTN